jgi:hypothetical protein
MPVPKRQLDLEDLFFCWRPNCPCWCLEENYWWKPLVTIPVLLRLLVTTVILFIELLLLWRKLISLFGGDGLRATQTGYPSGQEGACHDACCESPQGRKPTTFFGTICSAQDQELSERRATWRRTLAGARRRGRQLTGEPGVAHLVLDSGNSERMLSTEVPPLMTLMLGIRELAAWAGADNDVTPCGRQSTKSPNWERERERRKLGVVVRDTTVWRGV